MATFKPVVMAGISHIKSDGTKNIKIRIYHNKSSKREGMNMSYTKNVNNFFISCLRFWRSV